jgi:hypothetical protein
VIKIEENVEGMKDAYKILVGKPEEKRSHGKTRHRWQDNIRMILGKQGGKV